MTRFRRQSSLRLSLKVSRNKLTNSQCVCSRLERSERIRLRCQRSRGCLFAPEALLLSLSLFPLFLEFFFFFDSPRRSFRDWSLPFERGIRKRDPKKERTLSLSLCPWQWMAGKLRKVGHLLLFGPASFGDLQDGVDFPQKSLHITSRHKRRMKNLISYLLHCDFRRSFLLSSFSCVGHCVSWILFSRTLMNGNGSSW